MSKRVLLQCTIPLRSGSIVFYHMAKIHHLLLEFILLVSSLDFLIRLLRFKSILEL
jgi:hypothetical protein